jgi:cytochrome c biogenesis protein CcmG/thiol:disulfide interchange protein DsbE
MKGKILIILGGGLIVGSILGFLIFLSGSGSNKAARNSPVAGKPFPEVSLMDLSGNPVSLSSYKGHPLIVNFWATWCGPCKVEMPLLQLYSQRYPDLRLVGINNDETADTINKFLKANNLQIEVLLDTGGVVANQFQVFGFPTTYFVDADGIMRAIYVGELDADLLNGFLPEIGIRQ